MPKPVTRAEMEAATDNRFENPNSGVSAPSWKPDEVAKEKEEIAAEEAAAKAAAARVSSTEVVPRSSGGMGQVARNTRSKRLRSGVSRGPNKGGTKAQKAAKKRRSS